MKSAILVFFLMIQLSQIAYGDSERQVDTGPELKITSVKPSHQGINIEGIFKSAPAGKLLYQITDASNEPRSVSVNPLPIHLLLLVDNSSLCDTYKIDKYLNSLLLALPSALNPESLISVVSFAQDSKDTLAKSVSPGNLGDTQITCRGNSLSTSFESALNQVFSQEDKSNLPTEAWVYSSGNVALSSKAVHEIQERGVSIRLVLYVPMVLAEVQPLLNLNSQVLGDKFTYSALNTLEGTQDGGKVALRFPTLRFSAQFAPSLMSLGANSGFKLEALKAGKDGEVIAQATFHALLPKPWFSGFVEILKGPVFKFLVAALFVFLLVCLVYSYMPRKCQNCERTLRFSDQHCLFCHDKSFPSLVVGSATIPLPNGTSTLYKTRYGVGIQGRKSRALFKIERRHSQALGGSGLADHSQDSFAIIPSNNSQFSTNLFLNGRALQSSKFLADGDTVQIGQISIAFLPGGNI